jgi:hypothetical protein
MPGMAVWLVNNEVGRTWKEAAVASFGAEFGYFAGMAEENRE